MECLITEPWPGSISRATGGILLQYHRPTTPKTVLQFVNSFQKKTGKKARIAWNGGYILNPELVGKLGLPETYIGSPAGHDYF